MRIPDAYVLTLLKLYLENVFFYSAIFPKAINDKSDVKMEDLTSRENP